MSTSQITYQVKHAGLSDYAGPWLIEPFAARLVSDMITRAMDLAWRINPLPEPQPQSLTQMVEARDGRTVAVIQAGGIFMKQRPLWGGTSTIQLSKEIRQAAADPGVAAILLQIDSPGGTVAGLEDLAAEVKAAGKVKPTWTQAEDLLASAAYWTASQSGQIFANNQTALVGSIGVYHTVYDLSGLAEKQGIKALHFSTGPLKGAGVEGTVVTAEQQKYFQSIVDGVQAEFDRAVRSGRGLTAEQLAAVRTGGVWKAPEAQARGLIDGVQPVGKTIEQLARVAASGGSSRRMAATVFLPRQSVFDAPRGEL